MKLGFGQRLVIIAIIFTLSCCDRKEYQEQLRNLLNNTSNNDNSIKFMNRFKSIIDTFNINSEKIGGIEIALINDENKPIYIESLILGLDDKIVCSQYKYDPQGNLIQEYDPNPFYNYINYKYDSLNNLISKELWLYNKRFYKDKNDTLIVDSVCIILYKYLHYKDKIEEIGYRITDLAGESTYLPFKKYELTLNKNKLVISKRPIESQNDEGKINYYYDSINRKIRIEEYNSKGKLYGMQIFHYKGNMLKKKEELFYGNSGFLWAIGNLFKFNNYSVKYLTFYYTKDDLTCN